MVNKEDPTAPEGEESIEKEAEESNDPEKGELPASLQASEADLLAKGITTTVHEDGPSPPGAVAHGPSSSLVEACLKHTKENIKAKSGQGASGPGSISYRVQQYTKEAEQEEGGEFPNVVASTQLAPNSSVGSVPASVPGAYPQASVTSRDSAEDQMTSASNNQPPESYQDRPTQGATGEVVGSTPEQTEPVALAVTLDDMEREVRDQLMAATPAAEVITENKSRNLFVGILVILVVCAAVVAIVVTTTTGSSSQQPDSTTTDTGPEELPTETEPEEEKSGFVYVASLDPVNYCGHNTHRSKKCGGRSASITSPEEKLLVDLLKDIALQEVIAQNITYPDPYDSEKVLLASAGVWIGGNQASVKNQTHTEEKDLLWQWSDGSMWFDGNGSYWAEGQPDNMILLLPNTRNNRTSGQHQVLLTPAGEYIDINGCDHFLAPKAPGIYRLPSDYANETKYPDCQRGPFLEDHVLEVPIRPDPEWVYVLDEEPLPFCSSDEEIFNTCGGYHATITNIREKLIVDRLVKNMMKRAEDIIINDSWPNRTQYDGVWLGAIQSRGKSDTSTEEFNVTWEWKDGSPFFDHDGAYWAGGQPDNLIDSFGFPEQDFGQHAIILNADGFYEDVYDCVPNPDYKYRPSIYILPFDYTNGTKYPNCQTGSFTDAKPVPPRP